jgi:hypothetical protein
VLEKIRIGILPVETAGYVQGLETGLKSLGLHVRAISIDVHPAKYTQITRNPMWARWLSTVSEAMKSKHRTFFPILYLSSLGLRLWGAAWVVLKFDYLILNNGRSLLPIHADLLLYRLTGKKIIAMMGHGSEIRPACLDSLGSSELFTRDLQRSIYKKCRSRRRYARRVEALAQIVISTPTLSHYLRKRFVNGHILGIPVSDPVESITNKSGVKKDISKPKIKVVHVPSEPILKGTGRITEICSRLVSDGLIEFETKSRVSHVETLELLAGADILVDQLYSDVYMPVLATEAAFLGKPAIVAGYAWAYLNETSSKNSKPPVINISPENLEECLRSIVDNPAQIWEIGQAAKSYVIDNRNPITVANKYVQLLSQNEEYIRQVSVNPGAPKYSWGCGSSKDAIRALAVASNQLHKCF